MHVHDAVADLANVQLPYSWLAGKPGLDPTGTMSGRSRDTNWPSEQVKLPDASDVSRVTNCSRMLGTGVTKSCATRYTVYSVPAVIPHDPVEQQQTSASSLQLQLHEDLSFAPWMLGQYALICIKASILRDDVKVGRKYPELMAPLTAMTSLIDDTCSNYSRSR